MRRLVIAAVLTLALVFAVVPVTVSADIGRGTMTFVRIIAPQYEDSGLFAEGLAAVKKDGKWGYIDVENNVVIGFEYDYASMFREGYAVVGKLGTITYQEYMGDPNTNEMFPVDSKYEILYIGRIDKSGNYMPLRESYIDYDLADESGDDTDTVTEDLYFESEWFDFSAMYYYHGGWVNINNKRVFDTEGNQFKTDNADRFSAHFAPTEGLVAAWDDHMWDDDGAIYLNLDGSIAIDLRGTWYFDNQGNLLANSLIDEWDSIEWDQIAFSRRFSNIFPFNQGLAPFWLSNYNFSTNEENTLLGFIDKKGEVVVEPQFTSYWRGDSFGQFLVFNDGGLATVQRNGKWGAINTAGDDVISFGFDGLGVFSEGVAPFQRGELFGYIDVTGNETIPAQFRETSGFYNGIAVAFDGVRAFLIDRNGNEIPGSQGVDLANYVISRTDGVTITYAPGEYVIISEDGLYGFGKISYLPPLPNPSEMDDWAYAEVAAAIEAELVPVPLQNMFRSNTTRNDFSRLIMHALCTILDTTPDRLVLERTGKSLDAHVRENRFNDTTSRDILAAEALGIVRGYDEGGGVFTFRPHNAISRQEAAVLLWRTAGALGMDTDSTPSASGFADRGSIADWAVREVDFVNSINVMRGVEGNAFSPSGNYTRQQSYMTIFRLLEAMDAEFKQD